MTSESTIPHPPRHRWAKRVVLAMVVLVIALLGSFWLWNYTATKRLEAAIADIKSRGEPWEPADFRLPPIPANENIAAGLLDASARLTLPSSQSVRLGELRDIPYSPDERDEVQAILVSQTAALTLTREALARPSVNWNADPATWSSPSYRWSVSRDLHGLLAAQALLHHHQGRHDLAIEHLDLLLTFGDATLEDGPLLQMLLATAAHSMATDCLMKILPDLAIGNAPGQVPPQRLRQLIAHLLDDARAFNRARYSIHFERAISDINLQTSPGGAIPRSSPLKKLSNVPPMMTSARLDIIQFYNQVHAATSAQDWPTFARKLPTLTTGHKSHVSIGTLLTSLLLPSIQRSHELFYRTIADRRMAAIAIALRLHALDHATPPATLHALVPHYLPSLPDDPFAHPGTPLQLATDHNNPRLYSVGLNTTDDGGLHQPEGITNQIKIEHRLRQPDMIFYLHRHPRPAPEPQSPKNQHGEEWTPDEEDASNFPTTTPAPTQPTTPTPAKVINDPPPHRRP